MNVVAIIQTRMGSTRLPGKVLMPLLGQAVFVHVVKRLQRAKSLSQVVIATTDKEEDQPIVNACQQNQIAYFRGSEDDVLDRYYKTAVHYKADVIVRITSDCPLIDPSLTDIVVNRFLQSYPNYDYVSNVNPNRTYPRGLDVEVCSFKALETAWEESSQKECREHVTLYIYRNPELFTIDCVQNTMDESKHRWTVDTPEDFKLIQTIYQYFGHNHFAWEEVMEAFQNNPEWLRINQHIQQKLV